MKVGTIETIEDAEEKRRRAGSRLSGGPGSSGGGNNGGGGGGGGGDDADGPARAARDNNPQKSRILTTFLLIVVLMTFGGLIAAYVFLSLNRSPEWRPFDLPWMLWFSTSVLIASSVTYYLAERSLNARDQVRSKKFLVSTTALGAVFVSAQAIVWLELYQRGFYIQGNPYTGFFYVLTAVHAAHVLGGMIALSTILLRSWYQTNRPAELERRAGLAKAVGWYWHFMGLLWLIIAGVLAFWR
jgi:cytochrome c oxidase subunit III